MFGHAHELRAKLVISVQQELNSSPLQWAHTERFNMAKFIHAVNKTYGVFFKMPGEDVKRNVTHDGFHEGEYSPLYYLADQDGGRYIWNESDNTITPHKLFDTTWGDNREELEKELKLVAAAGAYMIKDKLGIH